MLATHEHRYRTATIGFSFSSKISHMTCVSRYTLLWYIGPVDIFVLIQEAVSSGASDSYKPC